MFPKEFDELIDTLKEFPNITTKQAKKIIDYMIQNKNNIDNKFIKFKNLFNSIKTCSICGFYSSENICNICSSNFREKKLMLIENISQIEKYEQWELYRGKYLKVPQLFTKKFERIEKNFNFNFLLEYINNFDEIIISLSPTPEGILSSNYIVDIIRKEKPKIKISKLAIGIPIGSSIDYIDQFTISHALKNREDIK